MSDEPTIKLSRANTTRAADQRTVAAAPVSETVSVPQVLGPVRLVREIGRGGMGCVWLGRDEVLQRDVAVKFVLNITAGQDSKEVEFFLEGARAAAAIKHSGLTTVLHADVVDDVPYLVMDYIDGASLSDVLEHGGPLSVKQTAAVLHAACDVLAALHDTEIVHRDIKPSNILVGHDGHLYLTDFGLACDRVPPGRSVRVKGLMGTPAYMSPEMFDGIISPRTDIYALGVMAYELLTGETPFHTETQIKREGEARDLPREKLIERGVPEPFIGLIERMTNPNAMFRLKSARQVQQLLDKTVAIPSSRSVQPFADLLSGLRATDAKQPSSSLSSSENDAGSSPAVLRSMAERKRKSAEAEKQSRSSERQDREDAAQPAPPIMPAETHHPHQPASPAERLESENVPCLRCGYNLHGLQRDGTCPECGTPVERSLQGNLLIYSAPEYVAKLHYGLICILLAVLMLIAGTALYIVSLITIELVFADYPQLRLLLISAAPLGSAALSILSVVGWWLFSAPDEAIVGHDTGDTPRRVLRITVIITAVITGLDAIGGLMVYQHIAYDVIEQAAGLIGGIAWLVQFFASLLYVRWLAHRLPDPRIVIMTETYLWLLPLIFILGFCIFLIGPLVATILYLFLLNDVRAHIRRIRREIESQETAVQTA